jgi:hypothetical protein
MEEELRVWITDDYPIVSLLIGKSLQGLAEV